MISPLFIHTFFTDHNLDSSSKKKKQSENCIDSIYLVGSIKTDFDLNVVKQFLTIYESTNEQQMING